MSAGSRKLLVAAVLITLTLGGCATGSASYKDAVTESLEASTAYGASRVTTESTGLFWGVEDLVVSVEFAEPPTDEELVNLIRDVTAPFPAGSTDRLTIRVTVTGGAGYSLEDQIVDWFGSTPVSDRRVTTEVSVLRAAIEGR